MRTRLRLLMTFFLIGFSAPLMAATINLDSGVNPGGIRTVSTNLTVQGGPADNGTLTYTWVMTRSDVGQITFSRSGTNAASSTLATFNHWGGFDVQVTIRNAAGQTLDTASRSLYAVQTLTKIALSPRTSAIKTGQTLQLKATGYDQFGDGMHPFYAPTFNWSATNGASVTSAGLLTAGSQGGVTYTVSVSASGSSLPPVTASIRSTTAPAIPVWKVALLVYRSINADYIDANGNTQHLTANLDSQEAAAALNSFNAMKQKVLNFSNGEARIESQIFETQKTVTQLAPYGNGSWLAPGNVRAELDQFAAPGTFDSVFVYSPYCSSSGSCIPPSFWVLSQPPYGGSNDASFHSVRNVSSTIWNLDPGGVYVLEWLNGICGILRTRDTSVPVPTNCAESGGESGYHGDLPGVYWGGYLTDLMTANVNGQPRGISQAAWRVGSILTALTDTQAWPSISQQPQSKTVGAGQTATLAVTATNVSSYQWEAQTSQDIFRPINGATGSSMDVIAQTSNANTRYRCKLTNAMETVYTDIVKVSIGAPVTGPSINTHPQSQTLASGQTVTFTVGATGVGTLRYQWQRLSNGTWSNVTNQIQNSFSFTVLASDTGSQFRCQVTDNNGTSTSNVATLTVTPTPPTITNQPANVTVQNGNPAAFSISATGPGALQYQWEYASPIDGMFVPLSGETSSTYSIPSADTSKNGYQYRCVVTGEGSTTSNVATLTVENGFGPPPAPTPPALDEEENAFKDLINQYRAQNGKPALQVSIALTTAGDWMSQDMGNRSQPNLDHRDSLGRLPFDPAENSRDRFTDFNYPWKTYFATVGENIAAGNASAQATFNQWVNSPGHNANMLNSAFRVIGISRVYVPGSRYGWYWTTGFGSYVDATFGGPTNSPPTATLSTNATTFTALAQVQLTATASDPDGNNTIVRVEFFNSETKIGEDTTAPYSYTWDNVPQGVYNLKAVAVDNQNATGTSNVVGIIVNAPANRPPTATIGTLNNVTVFTALANIDLTATATDPDGNNTITKVEFYNGATKLGEDVSAPYAFQWQNVPAGIYNNVYSKAIDNQTASGQSSPITLTVNPPPNQLPTVTISAVGGPVYAPNSNIQLNATANDPDGNNTIVRVEFYNGATKIGEDTTAPYSFTWNSVPPATYSNVYAKVIDNQNGVGQSSPISFRVNQLPTATMSSANGTTFTSGQTASLRATVSDGDGTISTVEFYNGSTKLGNGTLVAGSAYGYDWAGLTAGVYNNVYVKVTDNDGGITNSSPIVITVNTPANQLPTVSVSAVGGPVYAPNSNIQLNASASDPDGNNTIVRVEFYNGATKIGEDPTAPYAFTWNSVPSGSYTNVYAKVVDNQNGVGQSAPISFRVNQLPSASIRSANGTTFTVPATVALRATASDGDGTISTVEFYSDTTKIGSSALILNNEYYFDWSNPAVGVYNNVYVKVTDNNGGTTDSSPMVITVNPANNRLPTVSLSAPGGLTYPNNSNIQLDASASDADGNETIVRVEFYNGATKIGEDPTVPYSFTWNSVPAGTYPNVTAKAIDNQNGIGQSTPLSITVNPPASNAPSINTQPQNQSIYQGQKATFRINASGSGTIQYQWYVKQSGQSNFSSISGATSAIYETLALHPSTDNQNQYRCEAWIGNSNHVVSAAATITVTALTPPATIPAQVAENGQLTLNFPANSGATFVWTFTRTGGSGAPSFNGAAPVSGSGPWSWTTQVPTIQVGSLGLSAGSYQLTVSITDGSGSSVGNVTGSLSIVAAGATLSDVRVYPNPWRAGRALSPLVTFGPVSGKTTLKIFTVDGKHVRTEEGTASTITWTLKNVSDTDVASGIYLYVITNDQGQKTSGKVVIVR